MAEGFLPPLVGVLKGDISEFKAKLGEAAADMEKAAKKGEDFGARFSTAIKAGMLAAGVALTSIGAELSHLAGPMEIAEADLKTAAQNTGGDFEALKKPLDDVIARNERFGHISADTQEAVAKITTVVGSESDALKDMTAVSELAAVKHLDLTSAAKQYDLALQGNARALKELGLNVKDIVPKIESLTKATAEHDTAVAKLDEVQARVGADAEISAQKQVQAEASAATAAKAHRDAVAAVVTAQKDLETVAAGPTGEQLEQSYLAIANAAKGTRDAQQRVIDAQKAVDDLAKGPTADTKAQAQENVAKAQLGQAESARQLKDAQDALAKLQGSGTATARQLQDAQWAVQKAQFGVEDSARTTADAQAKLTKLTTDSLPGSQAMQTAQRNLADAQLAARAATDAQAKAVADQQKMVASALPGSDAYQAAERKLADAQDQVTATSRAEAAAAIAAIQAATAARKDKAELAKATEELAVKTAALAKAQQAGGAASAQEALNAAILAKAHGAAEAQAKTFHGEIEHGKVVIEDAAARLGAKFGPAITGVGFAMTGLSRLVPLLGSALGAIAPLVGTFGMALTQLPWIIGSLVSALGTGVSAVIGFGAALLASPITWIVAGILLVALAVYEIIKHWSTVKKWLGEFWDWLKGIFARWGPEILAVLLPFIGIPLLIVKHWGEIEDFFKGLWDKVSGAIADFGVSIWHWFEGLGATVVDAIGDAGTWLVNAGRNILVGLWNGMMGFTRQLWQFWWDLPKSIWSAIGDASKWLENVGRDLIVGLWNGLVSMGDWLGEQVTHLLSDIIPGPIKSLFGISSPSKMTEGFGRNLMEGMAKGLVGGKGLVQDAVGSALGDMGGKLGATVKAQVAATVGVTVPLTSTAPAGAGASVTNVYVTIGGNLLGTMDQLADVMVDPLRAAAIRRGRGLTGLFS